MKLNLPYVGNFEIQLPYFVGGLAAAVIVLGGAAYWIWGGGSTTSPVAGGECKPKETFEVTAEDFTIGDPNAPLTFIEYASMTCPHCARFHRDVMPEVTRNWIDKGYVRYVFREFPLDAVALTVSVVGRCLPRDQYLPFVAMMFEQQHTWADPNASDLRGLIKEMARRAGMSGDAFEACLSTTTDAQKVNDIRSKGVTDYCITGTPTFLLNGKKVGSGELPYSELSEKFREELKRLGKPLPAESAAPAASDATPASDAAAPAAEPAPTPEAPAAGSEGTGGQPAPAPEPAPAPATP